jgi:sugar transferase (PEP-CTERM/EpsH1 system associated)
MNDVLRILHIVHSLNVGGLERVVVDMAKGFRKNGHIVGICCLDGKEPLGGEAEKAEIKVFSLHKKSGIAWNLPIRIARIITNERYSMIHTHNEAGLIYGVLAALLAKVNNNIIHTEHGKEPDYDNNKKRKLAEKILLKKVKRVVTVSEELKKTIVRSSGIDKDRITVIQNGINIEKFHQPTFREETRRSLRIDPGDFVIGNISRMVPLKNHRFLISIFKELLKTYPKVKLILVGDGPQKSQLEIYSNEQGLSGSVIFLGERQDIPELLSICDLFVLPSLTEGICITLIEAMASGTPVVASKVGGNPEIIKNLETGFLIPLEDTSGWITTIKSLIQNPEIREKVSEEAIHSVTDRFSAARMLSEYEKLYYD